MRKETLGQSIAKATGLASERVRIEALTPQLPSVGVHTFGKTHPSCERRLHLGIACSLCLTSSDHGGPPSQAGSPLGPRPQAPPWHLGSGIQPPMQCSGLCSPQPFPAGVWAPVKSAAAVRKVAIRTKSSPWQVSCWPSLRRALGTLHS